MDQTNVYFNCAPQNTVHRKGERTISVQLGGSSSRLTLCVAAAKDWSKLPLFVVMKGEPGGRIEKSLSALLPDNVFGSCQRNAWMDKRAMKIWYETVFHPYICGNTGESGLILDNYICHKDAELMELMQADNTIRILIPPHYTAVLQPCDVGINKALKDLLKQEPTSWMRQRHGQSGPGEKVASPKRKELADWLRKIWGEFPSKIVRNDFRGSGYVYEEPGR